MTERGARPREADKNGKKTALAAVHVNMILPLPGAFALVETNELHVFTVNTWFGVK